MKKLAMVIGMAAGLMCGAQAAPLNAGQVGANAKWVLHLDVEGLRATQVGKILMQKLTTGDDNNRLNALAAMLGCDLRKDLAGVTLYGPSDVEDEGVVILHGKFNKQQLETFVKADDAYASEDYKGATIHSWIDKKKNKRMYGTILAGGEAIVMSGANASVKAELDVLGGGSSLATQNEGKLSLGAANGSVLIAAADLAKMKSAKTSAQTLKFANSASASISEQGADAVGTVVIEADSAQNAQQMNDALRGILAMIQLNDKTDQNTKDALKATGVDLQGTTLKISIHMPAQTLADTLQKKMTEDDAKKAASAPTGTEQK